MATYAEAEMVLALLHGLGPHLQKLGFRGRLKHLKRVGIPLGISPGRGKKIDYPVEIIDQWAFCLALQEFGMDPSLIAKIVEIHWSSKLKGFFKKARGSPDRNMAVILEADLMSRALSTGSIDVKNSFFQLVMQGEDGGWLLPRGKNRLFFWQITTAVRMIDGILADIPKYRFANEEA